MLYVSDEYPSDPAELVVGGTHGALRAEDLLQSALKRARRESFSDASVARSLERLIEACNEEANLSTLGMRALRIDIMRCLMNLLRFDALEDDHPSVLTRPIRAPVFITGMPRSGTTLLHRLILQDQRTAGPRLFQLMYPWIGRTSRLGAALRKSWVSVQLSLFRMIVPELSALHPVAADAPEECTDIIAHVFQSLRFESTYRVPSYKSWLQRNGFLDAYRFHRRFLQHLDVQMPGRRWVLKSPDHLFALDDIRKVYPDAHLVFVHRDPVRVLASVAKLTEVLRRPFARSVDRAEIGRQVCASWMDGAQRMCELEGGSQAVLHLHYRQIISSPLDAVRTVYKHCGLELTCDAEARMRTWLRTSGNRDRRTRGYDLAQFGLDPRLIRDRFARYTRTFGVEAELESTGTGTSVPS
jgi:Sulfotransferase family